mmetsp:Transcript_6624/g.29164  ORF Transcript_6624/g.29164 Transcript_6624/m.29164 type:complete len:278 (-) Transcript_6624:1442-2275(-)
MLRPPSRRERGKTPRRQGCGPRRHARGGSPAALGALARLDGASDPPRNRSRDGGVVVSAAQNQRVLVLHDDRTPLRRPERRVGDRGAVRRGRLTARRVSQGGDVTVRGARAVFQPRVRRAPRVARSRVLPRRRPSDASFASDPRGFDPRRGREGRKRRKRREGRKRRKERKGRKGRRRHRALDQAQGARARRGRARGVGASRGDRLGFVRSEPGSRSGGAGDEPRTVSGDCGRVRRTGVPGPRALLRDQRRRRVLLLRRRRAASRVAAEEDHRGGDA